MAYELFANVRKFFAGKWHYDGKGLNRDSVRIFQLDPESDLTPQNLPVSRARNPVFDAVNRAFEEFCTVAGFLSIKSFGQNRVPHMILEVDEQNLTISDTALTVLINRADGKQARFAVTLARSDLNGVKCTLRAVGKDDGSDSVVNRAAKWVKA